MAMELKTTVTNKIPTEEAGVGQTSVYTDHEADKSYRKKVDFWVLPLLCMVIIQFLLFECID